MIKIIKDLLPIGSVVTVRNEQVRIMINGIYPLDPDGNLYHYCGCSYPVGMVDFKRTFLFNQEDILSVDFTGFINEAEIEFRDFAYKTMLDKYNNGNVN